MKTAPFPIPGRSEFTGPSEVLVRIDEGSQPDSLGRVRFMAFWLTDQAWVPNGVRGQVFRAALNEFTAQAERRGRKVRVLPTDDLGDVASGRVPLPPTGGAR